MDFELSEEQRAFQRVARDFAAAEMAPHAARWDEEKIFPEDALRKAAALGFAGVYVREDVRGQGVGKALVVKLIEDATAQDMRQMIAVIGDSENVGSIGVHSSLGFHMVGTMRAVGVKFGRWLDVVSMQRALGRGDADMP